MPLTKAKALASWSRSNTAGLLILTAATWVVCASFGEGFLTSFNLFSVSQLTAEFAIIGLAQMVVLATGRMNLAIGAVGVCVGMLTGWLMGVVGWPPAAAIVVGLLAGVLSGALMAALELATGLSSFIVTIAMGSVFSGGMLLLTQGESVNYLPRSVVQFGAQTLGTAYISAHVIPTLILTVALWFIFRHTTFGWSMLAVGANQAAARLSGIRTGWVVVGAMSLSGLLAGVAANLEISRVAAAVPSMGTTWMMTSFIIPVLGGTALTGGRVSVAGALLAALFIETITTGLISLGVPSYWLGAVQAMVLLLAVLGDKARRDRQLRGQSDRAPGSKEAVDV
ncbi:MAG: ABC transporter permease [Micrococcales bacterium]|nr:ABC transporter permease [Micrococcales bacterium]